MMTKRSLLLGVVMFAVYIGRGQANRQLLQLAYGDSARLVDIFKDIHQNPELGFTETRTAAIIARELSALGYEIHAKIGKTGLVAILRNGRGPTVLYRADMDCNSVKENTGLAYASMKTVKKDDGPTVSVMHGCGHDAHVTWMLGVARIMVKMKSTWRGTLLFLAQPAEELLQGAAAMINDSMYEKGVPLPDRLVALHTWPIAVGTIMNGVGVRSAGSDQLDVIFHGIGGHGSAPETTKDAIVMASAAVTQYQTIISRNLPPQEVAVLTVSSIQAGSDYNVVPSTVSLKLNLRWFSNKTRSLILDGITRINEGLAVANNLPKELYPEVRIKGTAYPLVNDTGLTKRVNTAISEITGVAEVLTNEPPIMGSEDFPVLTGTNKNARYDYIFVGTANPGLVNKAASEGKKYPFFLHTSGYQVDLPAIPLGTAVGATALMKMLTNE